MEIQVGATGETTACYMTARDVAEWVERVERERIELPLMLWAGPQTWANLKEARSAVDSPLIYGLVYGQTLHICVDTRPQPVLIQKHPECPEGGLYEAPRWYVNGAKPPVDWRRI
jgi:hypothetical protein